MVLLLSISISLRNVVAAGTYFVERGWARASLRANGCHWDIVLVWRAWPDSQYICSGMADIFRADSDLADRWTAEGSQWSEAGKCAKKWRCGLAVCDTGGSEDQRRS
jgi:hypothetical protein